MVALHDHTAKPLPAAKAQGQHGHEHHHGHAHHHGAPEHHDAPEPRFSLIALSALQRLALVAPAILALLGLALWATQDG